MRLVGNQLLRNLSWLTAAELIVRLTRLAAAAALARWLDPLAFGIAAIALTVHELHFAVTRLGLAPKIVQCSDEALGGVVAACSRLQWRVALAVSATQATAAALASYFYKEPGLALPVLALAAVHLIYPFSMVPTALLRRRNRMETIALATVVTTGLDNLLTCGLAVAGLEVWAIVLPKLLVAPLWLLIVRLRAGSPPPPAASELSDSSILAFGGGVLSVELLTQLRNQIDYLLVGRFLGLEALGVYFVAFNAGLGFSQSLLRSFADALYPVLCEARAEERQQRVTAALRTAARSLVPVFLLQAALAPLYVPIVFGREWQAAIPIVILICLSAVPRVLEATITQYLRAEGRVREDVLFQAFFTVLLVLAVAAGLPGGLIGVATAVLVCHAVAIPAWGWLQWTRRSRRRPTLTEQTS